ncbi:MAG TPA: signal peptidase I, partial [Planococcus sp. (in: firmicutes)]|nr:signal peptidase I [Planococcus sp. (in: firmicutes)]
MYEDSSKVLIAWMQVIFFSAVILVGSRLFLFEPVSIHGESMSPTIENNDKLILAKISSIKNFDLIVFSGTKDKNYIKRVIGLPGDRVEIKNDRLFINGMHIEEDYLDQNRQLAIPQGHSVLTSDIEELKVPEGMYYVLGDNRIHSVDSRVLGFIAKENILGEA